MARIAIMIIGTNDSIIAILVIFVILSTFRPVAPGVRHSGIGFLVYLRGVWYRTWPSELTDV